MNSLLSLESAALIFLAATVVACFLLWPRGGK